MLSDTDVDDHFNPTIRLIEIDRNGLNNCGFNLTRSKFDPYPWISSVDPGSSAYLAGLKPGDCLLEVNGENIVGQRITEVAEIVKSKPNQVSLLLWNAGVDPHCTPETVCCGPMPANLQRLSACLSTILAFLECPICLDTISPPTYQCENGHLICIKCRTKSEKCPICRLKFNRGRSLLSDQVYNALVNAFDLRQVSDEIRNAKMAQIFKIKNKNRNVPDITITPSHTNKFLARIVGKSFSVDNLATKSNNTMNRVESEFNNLKIKSLSNQEFFHSNGSLATSRAVSMTRLNRMGNSNFLNSDIRPASCHGSFESLHTKVGDINEENILFHCPFTSNCLSLIKGGTMISHFQQTHEGPLMQFFKPHIKVSLCEILEKRDLCYIVQTSEEKIFFLKIEQLSNSGNIYLWTWFLGDRKEAKEYDMQIKIINSECNDVFICVRNRVCSLSSFSYKDIKDFNKGILFNMKTIDSLKNTLEFIVFDVNIMKSDCL